MIEVEHLTKRYGTFTAVDDISFKVGKGEVFGMLGTNGTLQGGRFRERLQQAGIETLTPAGADQERIMAAIYEIKGALGGRDRDAIGAEVREIAGRLIQRGAQGVVAGCTEIPLVLNPGDLSIPVFDTLLLLARAAITAAGRQPI